MPTTPFYAYSNTATFIQILAKFVVALISGIHLLVITKSAGNKVYWKYNKVSINFSQIDRLLAIELSKHPVRHLFNENIQDAVTKNDVVED